MLQMLLPSTFFGSGVGVWPAGHEVSGYNCWGCDYPRGWGSKPNLVGCGMQGAGGRGMVCEDMGHEVKGIKRRVVQVKEATKKGRVQRAEG